jgi:hypothetical protein
MGRRETQDLSETLERTVKLSSSAFTSGSSIAIGLTGGGGGGMSLLATFSLVSLLVVDFLLLSPA